MKSTVFSDNDLTGEIPAELGGSCGTEEIASVDIFQRRLAEWPWSPLILISHGTTSTCLTIISLGRFLRFSASNPW
jgi:hypothetical protein